MAQWTSTTVEDDFFGKDDDTLSADVTTSDRSSGLLAAHEAAALEERYRTLGYHETYEQSKESTLQDGFIEGYAQTFSTALNIGRLLGQAAIAQQPLNPSEQPIPPVGNIAEGTPEPAYLKTASRIRSVLQSITTTEEAVMQRHAPESKQSDESNDSPVDKLQRLENEVINLLNAPL